MQNFGGPPQGQMYGGGGGGGPQQQQQQQGGSVLGIMDGFPRPTGVFGNHITQYKSQLQAFQANKIQVLNQMHAQRQITPEQMQGEIHNINERIQGAYTKYMAQVNAFNQQQQMQAQRGGPGGAPGPSPSQQMPPPQMISAADKKKMVEMQQAKRMQQQQRGGVPGGQHQFQQPMQQSQQQAQQMRMQQQYPQGYRQQQQQQPQYPGMQMQQQQGMGMNPQMQQQHMQQQQQHGQQQQPPTPQQPHGGPPSVQSGNQHQQQQQQQFQQQQYYQQQNQQQMHLQHQQMQAQQQAQMAAQQAQQQAQMAQQAPTPAQEAPPTPAPPAEKPEDVKYKELLKEMRAQYYDVITSMHKRQATQKGLVQMINILEGDRVVPFDQLITLRASLHRLMIRDVPTFPMLEELRKIVFKTQEERDAHMNQPPLKDDDPATEKIYKEAVERLRAIDDEDDDPLGIKPFHSVNHLKIRVPDWVRKLCGDPTDKEKKKALQEKYLKIQANLKRPRVEDEPEEKEEVKKPKTEEKEEEEDTASQHSVDVEEDISTIPQVFVIKTVFDQRKPWIMPPKAREELLKLSNWSVDSLCLPSCSTTPFIIILVRSPSLHVNPLRISLPRTYPTDPCTIQFDRTFPENSKYGPLLQKLFEKALGNKESVRKLTDFVEAYHSACEEYRMYLPKYQVDSGETSPSDQSSTEMGYPRPAAVPIAHKGIVM